MQRDLSMVESSTGRDCAAAVLNGVEQGWMNACLSQQGFAMNRHPHSIFSVWITPGRDKTKL